MTAPATIAFVGDANGSLARSLQESLRLETGPGDGHLDLAVDGASAAVTSAQLAAPLKAGKTVLIGSPTAQQLAMLRGLTGQGPGEGVAAVSYQKQGRHTICRVLPAGSIRSASASDHAGYTSQPPRALSLPPGRLLLQPNHALARAMTAETSSGGAIPGFVAPLGAYAGYSAFQAPLPATIDPPIVGAPDDTTVMWQTQSADSQVLTEFYVYWVNGGNNPYFLVIIHQSGTANPGPVLANTTNSRGYFNYLFSPSANVPTDWNGNPLASGAVTLLAHSPTGAVVSQGEDFETAQSSIEIAVPMVVVANLAQGSGTGSQQFNASYQNTLQYTDWSMTDGTSGTSPAWQIYQSQPWDPNQQLPDHFSDWWSTVYNIPVDGSLPAPNQPYDTVLPVPDQSTTSTDFESVAIWQISSPCFTIPNPALGSSAPSCQVSFTGTWLQGMALLHNPTGCVGLGGKHHHLFTHTLEWSWRWSIDLGVIANSQNQGG